MAVATVPVAAVRQAVGRPRALPAARMERLGRSWRTVLRRRFGVPEGIASQLGSAFSKGRFFNTRIRDDYPFEELLEDPVDAWAFEPAYT